MLFLCYPRCSTCHKAAQWLEARGISCDFRDIKLQNPSEEELRDWYTKSGLPLRRFFNTSGLLYKEMGLKERLPAMTEDEMFRLLASDGMLVKRPLLVTEDRVLVGFRESEWDAALARG